MSRKLALFLGVVMVVSAMLLGGWAGFISIRSTPAAVIPAHSTAVKAASGPIIPFPQPVPPPEEETPAQAISAQGLVSNKPFEIVPGGMVVGQAVDHMWETTTKLDWQVSPTPLTPPNWFITGVVKRGEQTQIIVQFDGESKPRFLKIGDVLPGGGKLAWVRPDAIGVITPSRKKLNVAVLHGEPENPLSPALSASQIKSTLQPKQ